LQSGATAGSLCKKFFTDAAVFAFNFPRTEEEAELDKFCCLANRPG
jgi:hypothetical protein